MSRRDWLVVAMVVSLGSYGIVAQENRDPDQRDRNDPVRTDKDVLRTGSNIDPDTNAPVFRAKTLIGYKVKNRQGEDLGKIEELAIDPETGQIAYAVLSFGGFLGLGDKLFAIPWSALQPRHSEEVFMLDVDKEQLKNAPGFDKDKWPDMADRRWGAGVHGFYGARPYWETSGSQSGFMRDPGLIGKAGETHRLPFKLEKNKTYAFHVMAAGMGERFKAGTGTGTTRTDETRSSTETSRSDTSRTDPSRTGTYQTHGAARGHIYKVRVQDTASAGDSTLLVTVDSGDSINPTQVDERQDDRSSTEGRSAAGAASASKSFTVVVDQDGRVKSFRKEGAAAGSTPSTSQPGSATAGASHMTEEECSTHLQAVLGSGLHQQPLEVGKFYSASQLFRAGAISGTGTSGTTTDSFRSSAGAQSTSEALPNCQLRFDGKTRGAAGDIARFTIFSSDTGLSPASGRSGTSGTAPGTSATEGERRGDQGTTPRDQDPSRSGTATRALAGGERPIGELAYRLDDGLLEHLQVHKSASATDTSSPQHAKLSMGLTVRRIEAGSR
jgi:sporulation protein YlmC with PRC-barrel domain